MRTMDELDVAGKRVLLRLDLNVPMHDGHIADDGKIRACLPTVTHLLAQGAAVVVCSHLGRPPGAPDPAFSLAPVAARLGELVHSRSRSPLTRSAQQFSPQWLTWHPGRCSCSRPPFQPR